MRKKCDWVLTDDADGEYVYTTSCKTIFSSSMDFDDFILSDFKYCPFCGKQITK